MRYIIKVTGLSHKKEKKSDPRMDWLMFQNICLMYLKIKNKDPRNVVILLTIISKIYKSTKKKPKFNTHGVRLKQINIFGIW